MSADLATPHNLVSGLVNFPLSNLVSSVPTLLAGSYASDGTFRLTIKNNSLDISQFVLPPIDFEQLFDKNKFNSNFFQAFQQDFPDSVKHQYMFGLEISITNDLPYSRVSYLDQNGTAAFRFLVCIIFGLIFSLRLPCCNCFPQNLSEYSAVRAGLGLNCVNLDCKNAIKLNPLVYDDLIHSQDCSDVEIQAAFVSLSVFSASQASTNIQISQTSRHLEEIADPLSFLPIGTIISWMPNVDFKKFGFVLCDGSKTPPEARIKAKFLPDFRQVEIRLRLRFFIKIF